MAVSRARAPEDDPAEAAEAAGVADDGLQGEANVAVRWGRAPHRGCLRVRYPA
jgi:hypothetical protein